MTDSCIYPKEGLGNRTKEQFEAEGEIANQILKQNEHLFSNPNIVDVSIGLKTNHDVIVTPFQLCIYVHIDKNSCVILPSKIESLDVIIHSWEVSQE